MSILKTGRVLLTPAVAAALSPVRIQAVLDVHCRGIWGNVSQADWDANDRALTGGAPIHSRWELKRENKVLFVVTDGERHTTTLCFEEEA